MTGGYVASFVALMMTRVPALHENIRGALSRIGEMMACNFYQAAMDDPRVLVKEDYRRTTGRSACS